MKYNYNNFSTFTAGKYTGIGFDVKASSSTTIQVWFNGNPNKKFQFAIGTSIKSLTVKFADAGITSGAVHGIEFQPFTSTKMEINNIYYF